MGTTPQTAERPADKDATSPARPSQPPLAVFRFENVSVAAFTHKLGVNGVEKLLFTVSVRRSSRDKDGTLHTTHTLWPSDLLPAALALMKCYEFIEDAKAKPAADR